VFVFELSMLRAFMTLPA